MQKLFSLLTALVIITTVTAQDKKIDNSLLWKISGNGITQPSYLFGTIHAICPTDYFWTDKMEESFNATEQLYLELPMADPNFQGEMMQSIMLTDSSTLEDYFTPAQYEKLSKYLADSLGAPIQSFAKMKPFFLVSLFTMASTNCGGMPDSYEGKIIAKAQSKSFDIKGFETIQDQMGIFDRMHKDSLANMIMSYVDESAEMKDEFRDIVKTYQAQDIEKMYTEIAEQPDIAAMKDELLTNRNKKWATKMHTIMKEKPTFFAVGAGHLAGDDGVIKLLRKQGYKVEPVK